MIEKAGIFQNKNVSFGSMLNLLKREKIDIAKALASPGHDVKNRLKEMDYLKDRLKDDGYGDDRIVKITNMHNLFLYVSVRQKNYPILSDCGYASGKIDVPIAQLKIQEKNNDWRELVLKKVREYNQAVDCKLAQKKKK